MRHLLIAAGVVLGAGCTAPEAHSGALKDLKWGMTSAQVVQALDGRARVQRGSYDENGELGAVSVEDFNGVSRPVDFFFRDGGLVSFRLTYEDGFAACNAMRPQLDAFFGGAFYTSGGPGEGWVNSVWYSAGLPGQVQLMSQGEDADSTCRLTFMDEMAPNARDAQGLTRNEGDPTPRPDYQPYRPT